MSSPSSYSGPLVSPSSSSTMNSSGNVNGNGNGNGNGSVGYLSATILSVYDIPPKEDGPGGSPSPSYVSMSVLGKEVKTGPPSFKHKQMNNFKFMVEKSNTKNSVATSNTSNTNTSNTNTTSKNVLKLSAPLAVFYPTTATFRVVFEDRETLVARCRLSSTLQINQTQWLILNLYPETSYNNTNDNNDDNTTDTSTTGNNNKDAEHQPTLRIKLCLAGPYRTEIATITSLAQSWFTIMDSLTSATSSTYNSITNLLPHKLPPAKILLVPTVPIAAASVALLPVVLGVLTLGLPFFLPIIILTVAILLGTFGLGSAIYFSSPSGRTSASAILQPIYSTFCSTNSGQRLLYQTGPRPSPASLARTIMPTDIMGKLIVSLVIDFIGSSSYLLPIVGEGFDVAWAPIQTILLMALYDASMPSLKYISFMEEILPFTDVLPSGTLGWVKEYSPLLMEEGLKKVEDLRVVMRGEREAFSATGMGVGVGMGRRS